MTDCFHRNTQILDKLATLNQKVEAFKQRAREKRVEKAPNVFPLKSRKPYNTR
jgi:hypothetical protein